ncbi:hypothetical protein ACS5PN_07715 [Roseateles sp. NT4]|uniref:hypothetical protein n=1 Tax=Roseateles sp. NT4 TaxID=3453715 RepID=UPI003EED565B
MNGELALFFLAESLILGAGMMVLRPYKARRAFFTTYDLLCTLAVAFGVGQMVAGHYGAALWVIGMTAAIHGVAAGFLLDLLPLRISTLRGSWIVHAGSGLACFILALLGGKLAERVYLVASVIH